MPAVSGIILAGGRSRRLGIDKRSLFLTSARSQLSETVERMTYVADDIVVAGDPPGDVADRAMVVADAQAGIGPLAGLLTGLSSIRHERAVVVACDLPFLNLDLLRGLLAVPRDYALLVPRRDDGTLEMLHAVYSALASAVSPGYQAR
jgi:molybdopterin-guanine dinucleotide biosynthesis protein A